jgi:hypothetical protein
MNHICKVFFLSAALLLLPAFHAASQESVPQDSDWQMYARALELLLDANGKEAVPVLKDLLKRFPDSPLRPKVEALLSKYANQLDRSGIVLFYLTNMGTAVGLAEAIPNFLNVQDAWITGATGLAGIGAGITASYFLADRIDMSFGQELWIDLAQAVLSVDYAFLFDIFWPVPAYDTTKYPPESVLLRNRNYALGLAVTALAARAGMFAFVAGSGPLQPGKPTFILSNYAIATAYTAITLFGILQRTGTADSLLNDIVISAVPTSVALASYFLWDALPWRIDRTGFVDLGVLGGGLAGAFINIILSGFITTVNPGLDAAIILGGAVLGHGVGILLTQGIPTEGSPTTSQNPMKLSVLPTVGPKYSMGVRISLSY